MNKMTSPSFEGGKFKRVRYNFDLNKTQMPEAFNKHDISILAT